MCSKCSKCWPTKWHMLRHEKTCNALITHKFPGGVYRITKSIFEELDDVDICVPENLRFYPFRSTFDYESFFLLTLYPIPLQSLLLLQNTNLALSLCVVMFPVSNLLSVLSMMVVLKGWFGAKSSIY